MSALLYYIHDPMCSWCWGFSPVWKQIQQDLPETVNVQTVLGGLAPDSDEPMPLDMQQYIKDNWARIQQVIPETEFNYDFWEKCQPRRSTYPACRAVLAAKQQGAEYDALMTEAIQQGYYLDAKNPSDNDVLISLAESIGLDATVFAQDLASKNIQSLLEQNLSLYQQLAMSAGVAGFPSLALKTEAGITEVPRNYIDAAATLDFIRKNIKHS